MLSKASVELLFPWTNKNAVQLPTNSIANFIYKTNPQLIDDIWHIIAHYTVPEDFIKLMNKFATIFFKTNSGDVDNNTRGETTSDKDIRDKDIKDEDDDKKNNTNKMDKYLFDLMHTLLIKRSGGFDQFGTPYAIEDYPQKYNTMDDNLRTMGVKNSVSNIKIDKVVTIIVENISMHKFKLRGLESKELEEMLNQNDQLRTNDNSCFKLHDLRLVAIFRRNYKYVLGYFREIYIHPFTINHYDILACTFMAEFYYKPRINYIGALTSLIENGDKTQLQEFKRFIVLNGIDCI